MLTGVHILLTYTCSYECDHCFLHCSPNVAGTFTLAQLKTLFSEIERIGTIDTVYFEGGEAFLYYPLMAEGIRIARRMGLEAGIVTNGYWATGVDDARLWIEPLHKLGIADFSVSNDTFHHSGEGVNPAEAAYAAAMQLGMATDTIRIEEASVKPGSCETDEKGAPVIGGNVKFRGRAAEKLTVDLPTKPWEQLTSCPYEDLEDPKRVHVDSFGNVHICQGLSMGNMWETPLSQLVRQYTPQSHPICGPLIRGGPAALAREYGVEHEAAFVDECHFCYTIRKGLTGQFPQILAPRQVYGLTEATDGGIDMEFFETIHSRRSVRSFRPDAVPDETTAKLLEAVRSAPTAGNLQAYHVYLVRKPEVIRALAEAAGGQECVAKAPCVLVFCTDAPRSAAKYKERGTTLYCVQDATIAATMGHLAATALGLGSVLVGAFDEGRVAKIVGAAPDHHPLLMLPVGYPAESPAPTERRTLADMVTHC